MCIVCSYYLKITWASYAHTFSREHAHPMLILSHEHLWVVCSHLLLSTCVTYAHTGLWTHVHSMLTLAHEQMCTCNTLTHEQIVHVLTPAHAILSRGVLHSRLSEPYKLYVFALTSFGANVTAIKASSLHWCQKQNNNSIRSVQNHDKMVDKSKKQYFTILDVL